MLLRVKSPALTGVEAPVAESSEWREPFQSTAIMSCADETSGMSRRAPHRDSPFVRAS
jgi:hypothetical protein